ncbi:hypothetical protein BC936DRAFT_145806 [Jimgerdemannia flammicorona]|uniref:Uncharacterized protein n=1 Tax=Jimgerdemannia flammicorona TaxID=994334 RepID=A0A433D927_9FUNG|nr:hypothetical protein BC936DRAFT_145806 [Jimgerdemannia flammicorona]
MEPPSVPQSMDVLKRLFSTCSPELVRYIFSFTTREHASATGLFDLALQLPLLPDETTPFNYYTPLTKVEQAIKASDLPLLRYLLNTDHRKGKWLFLNRCSPNLYNHHVFMYLFTLLDAESPLLLDTDAHEQYSTIFAKIRQWATEISPPRIDILEWLHNSNLARQTSPTGTCCLTESPDHLIRLAFEHNWTDALVYLHSERAANSKPGPTSRTSPLSQTLWPNSLCSPKIHAPSVAIDGYPKIGWWGLLALYESHADEMNIRDASNSINVATSRMLRYRLEHYYLGRGIIDAVESRDEHVVGYLRRYFPQVRPTVHVVYAAIRNNDAEQLVFVHERYPDLFRDIGFSHVLRELKAYYCQTRDRAEGKKSTARLLQLLESASILREGLPWLMERGLFLEALRARDFEFLSWSLSWQEYRHRFKKGDLEKWRIAAMKEGCGRKELVELLDECL